MSKKQPQGFDMGGDASQDKAAFIKAAGTTPEPRVIGDPELAARLDATRQDAPQHDTTRYTWHTANPKAMEGYSLNMPSPLKRKLEFLAERKIASQRAVILAGTEKEADRLLIAHGIPPDEL